MVTVTPPEVRSTYAGDTVKEDTVGLSKSCPGELFPTSSCILPMFEAYKPLASLNTQALASISYVFEGTLEGSRKFVAV